MRKEYTDDPTASASNGCNGTNGSGNLPYSLLNNQRDFDSHIKYPIHVLQQEIDVLPPEINPLKREVNQTIL